MFVPFSLLSLINFINVEKFTKLYRKFEEEKEAEREAAID